MLIPIKGTYYYYFLLFLLLITNKNATPTPFYNHKEAKIQLSNFSIKKQQKKRKMREKPKNVFRDIKIFFNHLYHNFHTVEKGKLYRSAQPSPKYLEKIITQKNIKTIINLRGKNKEARWWKDEKAITEKYGIKFINIALSANQLTSDQKMEELIEHFITSPKPILIHCRSGRDRTGEVAALWVYFYQKNLKKALNQLSFFPYTHLSFLHPQKRLFIKKYLPQKMEQLEKKKIINK